MIEGDNCAYVIGENIKPSSCRSWYSCAQCEVPTKTVLYLKGLCPLDVEWYYDDQFYVYGTKSGRPHFRGIRNSEVTYDNVTEKWSIWSLAYKDKNFKLTTVKKMSFDVPLGSHNWMVEADGAHCFHNAGTTVRLTFSDCFPNQYTCNNGQCIPLRFVFSSAQRVRMYSMVYFSAKSAIQLSIVRTNRMKCIVII